MVLFIAGVFVGAFFGIMVLALVISSTEKDREHQENDKYGGQTPWPGL